MKTKRKEKKKKKKRSEEKKVTSGIRSRLLPESNSGPLTHLVKALPLGRVEHPSSVVEILLLNEFNDIFPKNDCSFDSENPT